MEIIDREKLSPMMKHYLNVKDKYKDTILFYRLGDFYEFFFDDAIEMSSVLDLSLTAKDCGNNMRAPMCGIPYHAAEGYIAKLMKLGYSIGICEQLSEPKAGKIVERDVIRIITPGTVTEDSMLDEKSNNYIACVTFNNNQGFGVAIADVTTGEFNIVDCQNLNELDNILTRTTPAEIISDEFSLKYSLELSSVRLGAVPRFKKYFDWAFVEPRISENLRKQFSENCYTVYELKGKDAVCSAAGALLEYLNETEKVALPHITKMNWLNVSEYLILDANTRRNLEIVETMRDRRKKGSLLALLDNTATSMGARKLKTWVEQPLKDVKKINYRLDTIEELNGKIILRDALRIKLKELSDIERITGKIAMNRVMPRDLGSLRKSFQALPEIKTLLISSGFKNLNELGESMPDFSQICDLLERAIVDTNIPLNVKDGGVFKANYTPELENLKNLFGKAEKYINALENKEKEITGIKNLRIINNRVFGYLIEVTKSMLDKVPMRYTRRQTTANSERFTTVELKELEDKIVNAGTEIEKLETMLYANIVDTLKENIEGLLTLSNVISEIDCLLSLSTLAVKNNYVKPTINNRVKCIRIDEGRHPVIEDLLKNDQFISNDTYLNNTTDKTMIITGPNMAGKSTYMRQVALITLMAHIGSFVPAKSAEICITDRIFTRVGASDDLAFGQSTFMVEMSETANILANATENSLVILDEIGRGTSTFDGLSIAWSVVEYLSKHMKCKTLFATHYHELTELEGNLEGVKNYKINVKEINGSIVFLRKVVRGGANKSFGIEVASLAGLPKEVIKRAKEISKALEQVDVNKNLVKEVENVNPEAEKRNKNVTEIMGILSDLNIEKMTPLSAFEILNDLITKAKG